MCFNCFLIRSWYGKKGNKIFIFIIIFIFYIVLNINNQSKERYPFHVFGYKLGDTFNGGGLDSSNLGNSGNLVKYIEPKEFFRRFSTYSIHVTPNKHKVCMLGMIATFKDKNKCEDEFKTLDSIMKQNFGDVKRVGKNSITYNHKPLIGLGLDYNYTFDEYQIKLLISDDDILKED